MKYILKKDLPLAPKWTEVNLYPQWIHFDITFDDVFSEQHIALIPKDKVDEWLEEVREVKSIYDLKKGDEHWILWETLKIERRITICSFGKNIQWLSSRCFLTEREAKRNKLLRELATREKWLPNTWDIYYGPSLVFSLGESKKCEFAEDFYDILLYHMWFIFSDEQEYNKYMTEEAKDLLFNL